MVLLLFVFTVLRNSLLLFDTHSLSKMLRLGQFLLVTFGLLGPSPAKCQSTSEISYDTCTTAMNGVMDGGHCFFFGKTATYWADAGAYCLAQNATLAQIHSSGEYTKIVNKALAYFPTETALWIALQRDTGVSGNPCSIDPDYTFWYTNGTQKYWALKAGNTWIKTKGCEDNAINAAERYFAILLRETTSLPHYIVDLENVDDWIPIYPLCQTTNYGRNYTLASGMCLTEPVIESAVVECPEECASLCSKFVWCRSFNFKTDTMCGHVCEFFAWTLDEPCPDCPGRMTVSDESCYHYSYVP